MDVEIRQLRYFCAVARSGNFTRAAEQEHVAQPSLSQQIPKLEDELGAKLFDRLGRTARLTRIGELFLRRAEGILRELGEARSEVRDVAGLAAGHVMLGAIATIAPYFLPSSLATFFRKYPSIQLNILEDIIPVLLSRLHEGSIDLALVALPLPGHELVCEELFSEPLHMVVSTAHPLASRKTVTLDRIEGEPFLLLKEGHCFRQTTITACRRAKVSPNVVFESGQFTTILGMVAAGMGVSVVPEMAVEPRKGCTFIRIEDNRAFRRVGLVRLKSHFQTRAELVLMKHFQHYVSRKVPGP